MSEREKTEKNIEEIPEEELKKVTGGTYEYEARNVDMIIVDGVRYKCDKSKNFAIYEYFGYHNLRCNSFSQKEDYDSFNTSQVKCLYCYHLYKL